MPPRSWRAQHPDLPDLRGGTPKKSQNENQKAQITKQATPISVRTAGSSFAGHRVYAPSFFLSPFLTGNKKTIGFSRSIFTLIAQISERHRKSAGNQSAANPSFIRQNRIFSPADFRSNFFSQNRKRNQLQLFSNKTTQTKIPCANFRRKPRHSPLRIHHPPFTFNSPQKAANP
jgi:hypothetical protein